MIFRDLITYRDAVDTVNKLYVAIRAEQQATFQNLLVAVKQDRGAAPMTVDDVAVIHDLAKSISIHGVSKA